MTITYILLHRVGPQSHFFVFPRPDLPAGRRLWYPVPAASNGQLPGARERRGYFFSGGERMTFWIVTADYRPLSERSPGYAFISATGRTAKQTERAFRQRYPVLICVCAHFAV